MADSHSETVKLVWDGLLAAERLHRYYGYLTERLEQINSILLVLASAFSSGAAAVWLNSAQDSDSWVLPTLIGLTALLNVALVVFNQSKAVYRCMTIHSQLARTLPEWENLWADVYSEEGDTIRDRWYDLQQKMSMITEGASSQFPLVSELADRSQREAYSYRQRKHAPTQTVSTASPAAT